MLSSPFFMVKEFLLLNEMEKNSPALPEDTKNPDKNEDASVEIQDLTCYWDKVSYLVFTGI